MHLESLESTQGARVSHSSLSSLVLSKLPECINSIYHIDTSVLLENIPLVKFIKTTSGTRVVYFP